MPDPVAATPSRRGAIARFLRDAVLRGRPRNASGILVYDALQATPTFGWNDAGYLNMGLWHEDTASSLEACETLLAAVADRAGLSQAKRLLDVGFGTGAQTIFFAGLTDAAIVGVNQSASQTAAARERVAGAGLSSRADLREGDATALALSDESFDVVTCVEAAFHFLPRERFFREAYRVLEPGGRLVLADILPASPPHWSDSLIWRVFDRTYFTPDANRVSLETYREQLKACGFDVQIEVVTDRVYVPFFEMLAATYDWWAATATARLLARWFRRRSPYEYVIAVATK